MKEEKQSIPINNKLNIYGILNIPERPINQTIIIFVHGLAASMNSHFFFNGSRYLNSKNYTTFRFDFYSSKSDARKLGNCSVQDHIDDLNKVIEYFSEIYSKIFLIGHSLGGPICINSRHDKVTSMCLWDPALMPEGKSRDPQRFYYEKRLDKYLFRTDMDIVLSKDLVEQTNLVNTSILSKINVPTKIISAGKFPAKEVWNLVFDSIKEETKEFYIIENSNHTFDFLGNEEELFEQTYGWLSKF